jgi:hypothetical protein
VQGVHRQVCSLTALAALVVALSAACMQGADCNEELDISQG